MPLKDRIFGLFQSPPANSDSPEPQAISRRGPDNGSKEIMQVYHEAY